MNTGPVKDWVKKADEDYESVVALSKKRGKAAPDVVCFLAQQCAEKYLKAYLVLHKAQFTKTHDLIDLLTRCVKIDSSFEFIHDLLKKLNQYAVEFRYPGEDATKREATTAAKAISEVRMVLRQKLDL